MTSAMESPRERALEHCQACALPVSHCICPYRCVQPSPSVALWLLQHPQEMTKPTNTGRLITDLVPNARRFRWHRLEPDPGLKTLLESPRYQPMVVFPTDDPRHEARKVSDWRRSCDRTPALILLDGTWQQAGKMFRLTRYLQALPVLSVAPAQASRYQLRRNGGPGRLCTAEIGAELLRHAGDVHTAQVLDAYFEAFSHHYQAARNNHRPQGETAVMAWLRTLN
ncbi:DTW domain-containing protein [Marinobacteraceae bacterium S3BR75-40.1]